VGLNIKSVPWTYFGRAGEDVLDKNWAAHRATLYRRVGRERHAPMEC
jgi:hypothetical protein